MVNRYPGALWVVDGQTNTSVTTIKGLAPLAYGGDVDSTRNLIFVAGWFGDISKIDGSTNTVISTTSGLNSQPNGLSVDPANQKVYVAIQQNNDVQIVDEKTNAITPSTIPVGNTPVNTATTGTNFCMSATQAKIPAPHRLRVSRQSNSSRSPNNPLPMVLPT